jgi:phosphatidylserine decarboxylase
MAGVIRSAKYQEGKFLNAMNPACADANEQNTVKVEGEGHAIVFKQIAGLLARRIVFTKKIGDTVQRGERIGVMKFGSRMDVFLGPSASIRVKVGDHVKGGSSTLAFLPAESRELAGAVSGQAKQRSH